jgi:aryl-alcohol dehydrogenase-like predicted oxidoreductase
MIKKIFDTHMGSDEIKKKTLEKFSKLQEIAENLGTNLAGLAIAWTLKCKDVTTTILGAKNTV